ncbi:MAG: prepilin-type N-terminal cleavage/methylation domain-containing protein [Acidobacteria bacterium]|nr:prepilin-type N-terminal cleavage/methylation domain-containing protein [Acidobacteriota bacterium]
MKKQKGFSLIELLIVVAIILIIAAIAIPNLMRARIAANESSGASQLRTLNTAEVSYSTAYSAVGYGTQAHLGGAATPCVPGSATACLIDNSLATNYNNTGHSGYSFQVTLTANNGNYDASAAPLVVGTSGVNSFCSIEDGVVRKDVSGAADTAHDTCLGFPSLQ